MHGRDFLPGRLNWTVIAVTLGWKRSINVKGEQTAAAVFQPTASLAVTSRGSSPNLSPGKCCPSHQQAGEVHLSCHPR